MAASVRNAVKYISVIWYIAVYLVRLLGLAMHICRVRICTSPYTRISSTDAGFIAKSNTPGVTILRPMLGSGDSLLYECLRSTFIQSYDNIEILMCVASPSDPAIAIAERLISEFPGVNARVVIGQDSEYGINPKVCNLVKGYKQAKHDIIWALDSNICMHKNALARAIPLLKSNVRLVHHLPIAYAEPQTRNGGLLDETYMLTAHSTFYSGINAVGIAPCVTGKSNIYRRSDLDASVNQPHGYGLQQFAKYMAEDQMISEALWKLGGRTAIAPDGAIQPLGSQITFKEFWRRRSRWIRLRKYMVTSATLVEPFTDCLFGTVIFAWLCNVSFITFWGLCGLWLLIDYINYRVLLNYTTESPRALGQWFIAWCSRELVAFPLWIWAMSGRRIWWRNHYYKIKPNLEAVSAD